MEPLRFITRHKSRNVKFYESECTDIDPESKTISVTGMSVEKDLPCRWYVLNYSGLTRPIGILLLLYRRV